MLSGDVPKKPALRWAALGSAPRFKAELIPSGSFLPHVGKGRMCFMPPDIKR